MSRKPSTVGDSVVQHKHVRGCRMKKSPCLSRMTLTRNPICKMGSHAIVGLVLSSNFALVGGCGTRSNAADVEVLHRDLPGLKGVAIVDALRDNESVLVYHVNVDGSLESVTETVRAGKFQDFSVRPLPSGFSSGTMLARTAQKGEIRYVIISSGRYRPLGTARPYPEGSECCSLTISYQVD